MPSEGFLLEFDTGAVGGLGDYPTPFDRGNAHRAYVSTGPAAEPVSTADMKAYLRVRTASQNDLVDSLVKSARAWAEGYTRRAFIDQTIKLSLDRVPRQRELELPRPPLSSVTEVRWFADGDAVGTVFANTKYLVSTERLIGRITLERGESWPTNIRVADGLVVTYVAGYGAAAANVPADIVTAIKRIVASLWELRKDVTVGVATGDVPYDARSLLDTFVVPKR